MTVKGEHVKAEAFGERVLSNRNRDADTMLVMLVCMVHVLSWSGGKDSTASVILCKKYGIPLDYILFVEVFFDKKNGISGEHPAHIQFIRETAKPLFESWGYKVVILHSDMDYLDFFHRPIKHPVKHMEHKGMKFGFPVNSRCGIQRDLKVKPLHRFYKSLQEPVVQYLGICADEPRRLRSMHADPSKTSILEEYGYTEKMAESLCREYGLLSPIYSSFPGDTKRGGCWFCPNAKLHEYAGIKKLYPDAWQRFVALEDEENVAFSKFSVHGKSLHEIDSIL